MGRAITMTPIVLAQRLTVPDRQARFDTRLQRSDGDRPRYNRTSVHRATIPRRLARRWGGDVRREVEPEVRDNPRVQDLCTAVRTAVLGPDDLSLRFLQDLLSQRELGELADRWAAARMLMGGATQVATA